VRCKFIGLYLPASSYLQLCSSQRHLVANRNCSQHGNRRCSNVNKL